MGQTGRRYDQEPKLNIKKVFAVILAILVIIMFVYIIKGFFDKKDKEKSGITSSTYFTIFKNDRWGIMDENENMIIDPAYQEMLIVPNPKIDVFLCTYDVDYETGEYKTKVLNSENEEIFKDYELVEAITNKDDTDTMWYEENVLKVKKDNKYGLIDLKGKLLLEPQYDEITPVVGIKGALKIKQNDKYGIVGDDGSVVVEPKYEDITILGEDNKSGYIIKQDNLYGIIDYSSKEILEPKYDEISKVHSTDLYYVTEGGTKKLVNTEKNDVLTTGFDEITQILDSSENSVIFKKDEKYGIMNIDGTVALEPKYDDLKEAKVGSFIAKKDNKYGIIDTQDQTLLEFKYENIVYQKDADLYIADNQNFESEIIDNTYKTQLSGMLLDFNNDEGYIKMIINDERKYYTFKFEEKQDTEILKNQNLYLRKKDGKYGFVDKEGNVVVDYIYDDVTEQNSYGYAGIKKDGKWGSINSKGEVIQEPTYDLENYLLVDFIGRWHLGKDVNMNYYNQM